MRYCFRVHPDANKVEIARAVEKLFEKDKVKVASVRTARVRGKVKRMGRFHRQATPRLEEGLGQPDP